MSTRIPGGFRFKSLDLAQILAALTAYRPIAARLIQETRDAHIAREMTRLIDAAAVRGEVERSPVGAAVLALAKRQREIRESGYRDPEVDFEFKLCVIPHEGRFYGVPICEQGAWIDAFLAEPWVEPWPYWNSSDRPRGVTQKEWDARGETWHAALRQDPAWRLSGCGFVFEFLDDGRLPRREAILAHLPARADRIRDVATMRVRERTMHALIEEMRKAGGDPEGRGVEIYFAALRASDSPEGRRAILDEIGQLRDVLPEITDAFLDGVKVAA